MTDFIQEGKYKIIMPLEKVPEFTIVTKPTGTKPYEVKRKLPVYSQDKELRGKIDINVPDYCIYLVADNGVNVEWPDTKVAIHFECIAELLEFVNDIEYRRESE